jgi:hypothetical protein
MAPSSIDICSELHGTANLICIYYYRPELVELSFKKLGVSLYLFFSPLGGHANAVNVPGNPGRSIRIPRQHSALTMRRAALTAETNNF